MSELLSARIQAQATKLGLTHLAGNLHDLLTRAEAGQMGYLDLLDMITAEETGLKEALLTDVWVRSCRGVWVGGRRG